MSKGGPTLWATVAAAAAVTACCALLPALVVGAGAASAAAGFAMHYLPVTLLGFAAVVWSGVVIARVARRRCKVSRGPCQGRSEGRGGRR